MAKKKDFSKIDPALIHYKEAYKSDHLGSWDLEDMLTKGMSLIFTIKEVKFEHTSVAGKKDWYNIAYFKEDIKPLVLNSGNADIVRSFVGGDKHQVVHWKDILIELYIDPRSQAVGGGTTKGVRIKRTQPTFVDKRKPMTEAQFESAKNAILNNGYDKNKLDEFYLVTVEQKNEIDKLIPLNNEPKA
jgi:hypothetical protein